MKILNPPDTVVYLEKTQNLYEKCFLNVRISHRKDEIYFMDLMPDLETKLISVLENIRKFSEMLPRPENLITKTEKLFLPTMPSEDHFFVETRKYVGQVINRNLANVNKCL